MDTENHSGLNIEEDTTDAEGASIDSAFDDDDRPGEDEDRGDVVGGHQDAEGEGEGEGEGDAAAAAEDGQGEEDPDDDQDDDKGMIPKSRFNQVNTRMRMAEAELERYRERERQAQAGQQHDKSAEGEQEQPQPEPVDIKALRQQRAEAMFEGDADKMLELDEQIEAEIERRAEARAMAAYRQQQVQTAFQSAVAETIQAYPFLDSQSEHANEDAINEVVEWRDFFMHKGASAPDALRKAAERVAPNYMPADDGQGQPDKAKGTKDAAQERQRNIIKRNANISQPASPNEAGRGQRAEDPDSKNIEDMSDDEFDALPEKEKAKLRGD